MLGQELQSLGQGGATVGLLASVLDQMATAKPGLVILLKAGSACIAWLHQVPR